MAAKHISGPTLGFNPTALYPYVLNHISEHPRQVTLRDHVSTLDEPRMLGAPDEAQFLGWLAATTGAKKVLEVGVFRGTTTLALAAALPADGKVVGLELNESYTEPGRAAWRELGLEHKIEIIVGPAKASMEALIAAEGNEGSFDMVFIDADKVNYGHYYELALRLIKKGGIIAVDNVLWHGDVVQPPEQHTEDTKAIVELNRKIRADTRVHAVMLPIADGCYCVRKL